MKKVARILGKTWKFLVKAVGYVVISGIVLTLLFFFVWIPFKANSYEPAEPTHAKQKKAYLKTVSDMQPKDTLPNVVIIFFDDLGYGDLSSYGNPLISTPAIDSIAKQGVKMNHFYSSSPVCTPSRAGLLSGRLPSKALAGNVYLPENHFYTKFTKFQGKANELPQDEILIPEIFNAVGYRTGMVGKWHLGDRDGHLPNDFGFDSYYGVHYSNDMLPLHIYRDSIIEEEDKTELVNGTPIYIDPEEPLKVKGLDQTTLTDRYTQEAVKFIENNKEAPFFLYFAHSFPHVPHFASKPHAGKSKGGLYGDVVEDLDRSVQAVMDALYTNGLDENTLVIITSDNGADYNGSAGNLRGRKTESYDGGQRVPMIVWWKDHVLSGHETNEMAMNTDILPTLLSVIDVPIPQDRIIDGKNILPILQGEKSPHEYLFYTNSQNGAIVGTRNDTYKYHEGGSKVLAPLTTGLSMMANIKPQLNDIMNGNESHNLIKKYPDEAAKLKEVMDKKIEETKDNTRGWISN